MNQPDPVGRLYDRLLGSETDKIAADNLTIHKRLHFPSTLRDQGIFDSNDWLRANIELPPAGHILDAGCGVGGTLFALLGERHAGLGITLSPRQVAVARQEAVRRGVDNRCHFQQQNYDEPLEQRFDLAVSIEALIHSPNLAATLQNLSTHLHRGGQLALLEDMTSEKWATSPTNSRLAQIWQQSWCLHIAYTESAYRQGLEQAGLQVVKTADFTPYVHTNPWPFWLIRFAWRGSRWLPQQWRGAKDLFVGGWALEALYRRGLLKYQVIIAEKV